MHLHAAAVAHRAIAMLQHTERTPMAYLLSAISRCLAAEERAVWVVLVRQQGRAAYVPAPLAVEAC